MSVAAQTAARTAPTILRDRFGNRILGAPGQQYGRLGQYRIVSRRNGETARVCGEAESTKHLLWWEYDADERRYVCALCFATGQPMNQTQPQTQSSSDDDGTVRQP